MLRLLVLFLNAHLCQALLPSSRIQKSTRFAQTRLYNLGSDVLVRPDDEDSPEFKEYLRQLMLMQANRAKSGFAAPSSASSDAYIAKLNRIKIERARLRELGLPEDAVDTGYREEDFKAAVLEGQEPAISNTAGLTIAPPADIEVGVTRTTNAKPRSLTNEEILAAKAAEENVKRIVEKVGLGEVQTKKEAYARPIVKMDPNDPSIGMIEKLLGKSNIYKQTATAASKSDNDASSTTTSSSSSSSNTIIDTTATVTSTTPAAVVNTPIKAIQPPPPSTPIKPISPSPVTTKTAASVGSSSATAASRKTVVVGEPLSEIDQEPLREALELLIKHRGGGPFGAGRLQDTDDILKMADVLLKATAVLRADAVKYQNAAPVVQSTTTAVKDTKIEEKTTKLPPLKIQSPPPPPPAAVDVAQSAPVEVRKPATPTAAAVVVPPTPVVVPPPPAQVAAKLPPADTASTGGNVPIALGLDKFLAAPSQTSLEELEGLRDGLIECLSLLQQNIVQKRSIVSEEIMITSSSPSPPPSPPSGSIQPNVPLMMTPPISSNDSFPSSPPPGSMRAIDDTKELSIEDELKLTLGLLLKHRGGPGFGHGRLEGSELDRMSTRLRSLATRLSEEAATNIM